MVDEQFNFYQAERAGKRSRLEDFSEVIATKEGDPSIKVTFEADGRNTTVTTR